MITRVDAMATVEPPLRPRRPILPRWLGVVFPVVILPAMGFAVPHPVTRMILPSALALATSAGIGMIAGFAARRALRKRASLVRGVATLAALIVGLLLLGLMTDGKAGIGPLRLPLARPNWIGLVHVMLSALAAWLALEAWSSRPAIRRPLRQRLKEAWQRMTARARWPGSALQRRINRATDWLERARAWRHEASQETRSAPRRTRADRARQSWFARFSEAVARRSAFPWRAPQSESNHRSRIRLTGAEEHRCPYCLELVEPHDPRGVETCPICHTHHHADCWAVTGMCQVPHHH